MDSGYDKFFLSNFQSAALPRSCAPTVATELTTDGHVPQQPHDAAEAFPAATAESEDVEVAKTQHLPWEDSPSAKPADAEVAGPPHLARHSLEAVASAEAEDAEAGKLLPLTRQPPSAEASKTVSTDTPGSVSSLLQEQMPERHTAAEPDDKPDHPAIQQNNETKSVESTREDHSTNEPEGSAVAPDASDASQEDARAAPEREASEAWLFSAAAAAAAAEDQRVPASSSSQDAISSGSAIPVQVEPAKAPGGNMPKKTAEQLPEANADAPEMTPNVVADHLAVQQQQQQQQPGLAPFAREAEAASAATPAVAAAAETKAVDEAAVPAGPPASKREAQSEFGVTLNKYFGNDRTADVASHHFDTSSSSATAAAHRGERQTFQIHVPKPYPGVQLRKSMNLADKQQRFLEDGKVVKGEVDPTGRWLKIGADSYLPFEVNGICILHAVKSSELSPSQKAKPTKKEPKEEKYSGWWGCCAGASVSSGQTEMVMNPGAGAGRASSDDSAFGNTSLGAAGLAVESKKSPDEGLATSLPRHLSKPIDPFSDGRP